MNDFFKTKVGFMVGLLAAAFAIQPIVDSNQQVGFIYLDFKITISHAYNSLMLCLGISVYCSSLQFATDKYFLTLDKLSNVCYSIALAIPPIYLFFWLINLLLESLYFVGIEPSKSLTTLIAGVLTGIAGALLFKFLVKSIKLRFEEEQA